MREYDLVYKILLAGQKLFFAVPYMFVNKLRSLSKMQSKATENHNRVRSYSKNPLDRTVPPPFPQLISVRNLHVTKERVRYIWFHPLGSAQRR